jgi:periplasmic divalent cation tolerance protein
MTDGKESRIVLVTCGSIIEARRIASKVVRKKLAACVNIVLGPIQSIYRWKGKVHSAREVMMIMKTSAKCVDELEKHVKSVHTYEVPEFIVVPITSGSKEYLDWVKESVKG